MRTCSTWRSWGNPARYKSQRLTSLNRASILNWLTHIWRCRLLALYRYYDLTQLNKESFLSTFSPKVLLPVRFALIWLLSHILQPHFASCIFWELFLSTLCQKFWMWYTSKSFKLPGEIFSFIKLWNISLVTNSTSDEVVASDFGISSPIKIFGDSLVCEVKFTVVAVLHSCVDLHTLMFGILKMLLTSLDFALSSCCVAITDISGRETILDERSFWNTVVIISWSTWSGNGMF